MNISIYNDERVDEPPSGCARVVRGIGCVYYNYCMLWAVCCVPCVVCCLCWVCCVCVLKVL